MQNRSYRQKKSNKSLGIKLIAIGIVLCATVFLTEKKIEPIIKQTCDYHAKIIANEIINEGIDSQLNKDEVNYEDLVTLTTDGDGKLTALECNMYNANILIAKITDSVTETLEHIGSQEHVINAGSLTGVNILYGRGFPVKIKLTPTGYVESSIVSEFKSAGINQTMHEIVIEITVTLTSQIPFYSQITVETNTVTIAHTVIVGDIPNYYGYDSNVIAKAKREVE